jgi:hypothetical protein
MSDLTITASRVAFVRGNESHLHALPAAAATEPGVLCYQDTNGKWAAADADTASHVTGIIGISITKAGVANEALTCALPGAVIDLGDALDGLAFEAAVYAGNTAGVMGDAAGTTSRVVGRVIAAWGSTTPDKLLQVM